MWTASGAPASRVGRCVGYVVLHCKSLGTTWQNPQGVHRAPQSQHSQERLPEGTIQAQSALVTPRCAWKCFSQLRDIVFAVSLLLALPWRQQAGAAQHSDAQGAIPQKCTCSTQNTNTPPAPFQPATEVASSLADGGSLCITTADCAGLTALRVHLWRVGTLWDVTRTHPVAGGTPPAAVLGVGMPRGAGQRVERGAAE